MSEVGAGWEVGCVFRTKLEIVELSDSSKGSYLVSAQTFSKSKTADLLDYFFAYGVLVALAEHHMLDLASLYDVKKAREVVSAEFCHHIGHLGKEHNRGQSDKSLQDIFDFWPDGIIGKSSKHLGGALGVAYVNYFFLEFLIDFDKGSGDVIFGHILEPVVPVVLLLVI